MSRRCRQGQRARIIGGGSDQGAIVLVVKRYFGEPLGANGAPWVERFFPWVVSSLGRPLHWTVEGGSETGTAMVIVIDDSELEPLDDDDEHDSTSTSRDKPVKRPQTKGVTS